MISSCCVNVAASPCSSSNCTKVDTCWRNSTRSSHTCELYFEDIHKIYWARVRAMDGAWVSEWAVSDDLQPYRDSKDLGEPTGRRRGRAATVCRESPQGFEFPGGAKWGLWHGYTDGAGEGVLRREDSDLGDSVLNRQGEWRQDEIQLLGETLRALRVCRGWGGWTRWSWWSHLALESANLPFRLLLSWALQRTGLPNMPITLAALC